MDPTPSRSGWTRVSRHPSRHHWPGTITKPLGCPQCVVIARIVGSAHDRPAQRFIRIHPPAVLGQVDSKPEKFLPVEIAMDYADPSANRNANPTPSGHGPTASNMR